LLLTIGVVLGLLILDLFLLLGNNVSTRREVFGIIGE
jgi:hypothetical protein